jgi:NAD(P)-dependent dehydrogenase (short-subunit alcohol dehydrogenase family)
MATWLITGCSTGLGRALAAAALDQGEKVVVTARDAATVGELSRCYPETALALPLDVTDRARVRDVVRCAVERFGAIDVLVNNAGHSYRAAVEEAADNQVRELFATNFFGPAALIQAILPGMRDRRSGTIVNISSIGARSSPIGSGYYAASKAALEAMTRPARAGHHTRRSPARRPGPGRPGDHQQRPTSRPAAAAHPRPRRTHPVPRRNGGTQRRCRRLGADQPGHQLPQPEQLTQTGRRPLGSSRRRRRAG